MTCIVAISKRGKVFMGGDSAVSDYGRISIMRTPKVARIGCYVIGICGDCGTSDVISVFKPSDPSTTNIARHMRTTFAQELRDAFDVAGFERDMADSTDDKRGFGFEALVGVKGRIFKIYSDIGVDEAGPYASVGSGAEPALAILDTLHRQKLEPKKILTAALVQAEKHTAYVRRPWRFAESA